MDDHDCFIPFSLAEKTHIGNIDLFGSERAADFGHDPRYVVMTCKEGVLFSRDLDRIPIDFCDQHTTSPQRSAHDRHMRAIFAVGFDLGHIRMPHVIF